MPPWILPAGPSAETGIVTTLTPGFMRMTASTAALVSFEESGALLHELAGVEVSVKQVERAAEALGAEIAVDERQDVERMREVAPTMYLGLDGTGVPMRPQEVADRAGKQETAPPKPAKPSWSLSGRRNREIGKANPCAIGIDQLFECD